MQIENFTQTTDWELTFQADIRIDELILFDIDFQLRIRDQELPLFFGASDRQS